MAKEVTIGLGDKKEKVNVADDVEAAKLIILQNILLQLNRMADKL